MPISETTIDNGATGSYEDAQMVLVKQGITHMIGEGNQGFVAEGESVALMRVNLDPIWDMNAEELASLEATHAYYTFMQMIPNILFNFPDIYTWIAKNGKKLELQDIGMNDLSRADFSPFLLRADVLLSSENNQFYIVDPNVVPMGLPDMIAMKDASGDGFCELSVLVDGVREFLLSHGLDPENATIGLLTLKDVGSAKSHEYLVRKLKEFGLNIEIVTTNGLRNMDGKIFNHKGTQIDVVWSYVRPLAELCPVVFNAWQNELLPMINPPGIKIYETQVWFALMRLPGIKKYIESLLVRKPIPLPLPLSRNHT